MKKVLLFLMMLTSISSLAQKRIVEVRNNIFYVKYSEELEQPLTVVYKVSCTATKFSRAGLDFFTTDSIHTSNSLDYANNEYDKGHMAPAAAFACDQQTLKATFSYLNCALQHQNLNRGVWRLLESHERELAKTEAVTVRIDIEFKAGAKKLATGATVPTGFYKTVTHGNVVEKYYFPNETPAKKYYTDYLIVNK